VSFPVAWDDLDRVDPGEFTVRTAARLIGRDSWAGQMPEPQRLSAALIEEGHAIPVARVQAMHEGKRRARARRASGTGTAGGAPGADGAATADGAGVTGDGMS